MTDIDFDQPVQVSDRLAATLTRMLARSYPDITAADVTADLARPASVPAGPDGKPLPGHEARGILGMMAAGSLEDAVAAGSVTPDSDGVLDAAI